MKILIVCVNYNSYGELRQFLDSVEKSADNAADMHVEVIIADNSTMYEEVDVTSYKTITVSQQKFDNLGYMGGAAAVINNIDNINLYKYVVISNVDLVFDKYTISRLEDVNAGDDVAWIAPSIYSEKYQKDLNPNILSRYSYWKLSLLKLTYNRFFFSIYTKFYFSKKDKHGGHPMMNIYAGHGAVIILTSSFFKSYKTIDYPIFLYGEELYFAELIYQKGLKVLYTPFIQVNTTGGVSTSKIPPTSFFDYNRKAINYILDNFY